MSLNQLYKKKLFITHNGVSYYGWDFVTSGHSYDLEHSNCLLDGDAISILKNPTYSNFTPNEGDEIHIENSPIAVSDIRKHYKLKRQFDSGSCNVYAVNKGTVCYYGGWSSHPTMLFVYPDVKTIVGVIGQQNNASLHQIATEVKELENQRFDIVVASFGYTYINLSDFEQAMLLGTVKKPVISFDQLPIHSENELTIEQLQLIEKLGMEIYSEEAKRNYVTQMCALNQYNWREYPGALSVFFSICQKLAKRASYRGDLIFSQMSKAHHFPKAAQEIVKKHATLQPFKSQKDYELGLEILESKIGKVPEFVTVSSLFEKSGTTGVPILTILHCFDDVVRLKHLKIDDNTV